MFKKLVYGVGLLQIGYVGYNTCDYLYRYTIHQNCNLKSIYPQDYAFITGASQGLGYGYAEELAKRGYNVIMVSRTKKSLEEASNKLQQKYSNVKIEYRTLDLESEDPNSFNTFFQNLKNDYGDKIGIFVNNAAAFEGEYIQNLKPQQIKSVINTNVLGQTFLIHKELQYAEENSKNKQAKTLLVNIGSQKAYREAPSEGVVYYATKQYMNHLTQNLRQQYDQQDKNIQIIHNAPGYIDSPMLHAFYPDFKKTFGANFLDQPQIIAKQALDQVDLNPQIINGTDKQAFGNVMLKLQSIYTQLIN